ncbi:MAG: hypothetical protein ACRDIC_03180 [bacterium]
MSYVAAAYFAVAALAAGYVFTLAARQRIIAELADAALTAPSRPAPSSGHTR